MRKIRGSVTVTDNETGKCRVYSKKEYYQKMRRIKNAKTKIAAIGLAAGIGLGTISNSIISNLANNANYIEDTRDAIKMAASTEEYLNRIEENQMLQEVIGQEHVLQIEELSSAINTYKELRYKTDRTFKEEKEYIEACGAISESRELVMNLYTNEIRAKVAEVYGITDEIEIAKIEVKDYIVDTNQGPKHNPQIILPDGTIIKESNFWNNTKGMDRELAEHVIRARSLGEAGMFSENKKIEDLPLDDIINTFEMAKEFAGYTVEKNSKGDFKTIPTEEIKTNESPDNEER